MWVFNANELAADMSCLGYALTFKSVIDREYSQEEFEARYRFARPANLLFERAAG